MSESKLHKIEKKKAAGKHGKQEVVLPSRKRLDAESGDRGTEVELSGRDRNLEKAIGRLLESKKKKKELRVPREDAQKAKKLANTSKIQVRPIKK